MLERNHKIEITDEGVIYIDYLTADYQQFDKLIVEEPICISFYTKEGYDHFIKGYKKYLYNNTTVEEIHSKINYIEYLFKSQIKLGKEEIEGSFEIIKAASKIIGLSEKEIYKYILKNETKLNK